LVFGKILVLVAGLTIQQSDAKCAQYLFNKITHPFVGAIAYQLIHCSPLSNANEIIACIKIRQKESGG
jgi:hypothetical protein